MYKESKYNFYVKKQDGYLVYNTLYGGLAFLEKKEYEGITSLSSHFIESEKLELLREQGFIVDELMEEFYAYEKLRKIVLERNSDVFNCVIAVTTDCNARCPYCYEKGIRSIYMDEGIVRETVECITRNAVSNVVDITWFGGEPLLNTWAIDTITKALQEQGIEYSSTMITNGFLFDEQKISKAKKMWNLKSVQISLDGINQQYEEKKRYKGNCVHPFQTVLKNIEILIRNQVFVSIRLNIDNSNKEDIVEVVKYLRKKVHLSKYVYIYPAFLTGMDDGFSDAEKVSIIKKILPELPTYSLLRTQDKLQELPKTFPCMRAACNSIVIDADGSICRCEHNVGREKKHSLSSVSDIDVVELDFEIDKQCIDCVFYPKCLGGCMADRINGCDYCNTDKYIIQALLEDY